MPSASAPPSYTFPRRAHLSRLFKNRGVAATPKLRGCVENQPQKRGHPQTHPGPGSNHPKPKTLSRSAWPSSRPHANLHGPFPIANLHPTSTEQCSTVHGKPSACFSLPLPQRSLRLRVYPPPTGCWPNQPAPFNLQPATWNPLPSPRLTPWFRLLPCI